VIDVNAASVLPPSAGRLVPDTTAGGVTSDEEP